MPAPPPQSPMQRAMMNRRQTQQRRSFGLTQGAEGVPGMQQLPSEAPFPNRSPLSQPTTTSHASSSPATNPTKSPNFVPQLGGAVNSPNIGPIGQQQQPASGRLRPQPPRSDFQPIQQAPQRPSVVTNVPQANRPYSAPVRPGVPVDYPAGSSNYYPYPSPFQSHMDQLGKLSRFFFRYRTMFVLG